jgi:predicted RNase H-like HicB family nuclease
MRAWDGSELPSTGLRLCVAHVDRSETGGSPMRQVILYLGEDGYWVAECPSLPGCISQGKTKQEALANIREAIEGYIAALQDDALPVPEERFEALLVAV